jgi:predicted dehydrogenase
MTKLRMGVLGTSEHYSLRVAASLRRSALIEPYAIASRNADKAKQYARDWCFTTSHGSYEELLNDQKVDFVYIPLPNHLHLEYIKKAADAGKPVLCEKPLGLNAREAMEAASYCDKKGVPLMEAFMYRFHPQWRRAKEIAYHGEIGEVISTMGFYSYTNHDGANIRNIADAGGGALLDIGCYCASSSRYLMGREPERAIAVLLRDSVFKTDVLVSGILDYGAGHTATFTVSTQIHPYQRITAVGRGGALSIEVPYNMYGDIPGKITVHTGQGERVIKTEIAEQYLLEFDAFARAILDKSPVPTPVSDAVANMAVLDALFASAASGNWENVARY